jgi:hypothetical protein
VLSWRLSNTLTAGFCVAALSEALARFGKPGIFNTDQGAQFTSDEFTQMGPSLSDQKLPGDWPNRHVVAEAVRQRCHLRAGVATSLVMHDRNFMSSGEPKIARSDGLCVSSTILVQSSSWTARNSASTVSNTGSCAVTKRCRSKRSPLSSLAFPLETSRPAR